MDSKPVLYGALAAGVLSFIWAPIFVRWAGDVPGLALATWRTVTAAVVLWPWWIRAQRQGTMRALSGREWVFIGAAGALLGLHFVAWIESLQYTSVASASVLVTTSPIFLAGLGYVVLGERLRWATLGAIVVAVAGAACIGWADAGAGPGGTLWGNGLALGAALLVSVYLLIGRVVRQRVDWLAYVTPLYTVAAAVTVGLAWSNDVPLLGYSAWPYAMGIALALGPQIIGHGAFNYAVKAVPAALVAMLALLEPVGASLLAYGLFGEVPKPLAVAGMLLVLVGVAAVVQLRRGADGREVAAGERVERSEAA
ncbi:DMT family transporter [Salisaeta longa]|uniref:DMT family transporter n=1 Tax=Salisaeta longa TaxID=503170 RepID=UPI0003B62978|nr:DMT family transporter [Salisaeta longa]